MSTVNEHRNDRTDSDPADTQPVFWYRWSSVIIHPTIKKASLEDIMDLMEDKVAELRALYETEAVWVCGDLVPTDDPWGIGEVDMFTYDPHVAAKYQFEDVWMPPQRTPHQIEWREDVAAVLIAENGKRTPVQFW